MIYFTSNWAAYAERCGYRLHRNVTDSMGRKWRYMTSPLSGSGSIGYFADLREMATYLRRVTHDQHLDAHVTHDQHLYGRETV